jgi:hypothetical protein
MMTELLGSRLLEKLARESSACKTRSLAGSRKGANFEKSCFILRTIIIGVDIYLLMNRS